MGKLRRACLLAATVLCAGVVICQGRVFFRRGNTADSTQTIVSAGGKLAYEAPVSVNGGKGHLTVFGFDASAAETVKALSEMFKITDFNFRGGTMGFGTYSADGRVTRFTVLRLEAFQKTIVMQLDQSESDFQSSRKPPERHFIKAVPPYPGSTPSFFARDDNTQLSLAMSTAAASTDEVSAFYNASLPSSGWTAMTGPTGTTSGMAVYMKGQDICVVLVDAAERPSEVRITLLHKQQVIR